MTLAEEIKKIIEQYEKNGYLSGRGNKRCGGMLNEIEKALDNHDKDVCPSCDSTVDSQLISKCRKCKAVQCPKC